MGKVLDNWKNIIKEYGVPSIVKENLLTPYFSKLKLKNPILDVGFGTGYFSELLSIRGFDVTGFDQNRISLISNVNYVFGDACNLPLEDKTFGSVLLINVLSCVDKVSDRLKILSEIKRVKKKNGRVYVVNTSENLFSSPLSSKILSFNRLGKSRVFLSVKKVDGSVMEFEDYIIRKEDMKKYCKKSGLKMVGFKDFVYPDLDRAVYSLYVLE